LQIAEGKITCQKVKISGDGAKISRVSNYIVLSFALLSDEKEVMSTKGKSAWHRLIIHCPLPKNTMSSGMKKNGGGGGLIQSTQRLSGY
jgi:hypothetical protein